MESPTITIDLLNDSIRDLELVRKLIDDELTKRRSRKPLSERIVLVSKSPAAAPKVASRVPTRKPSPPRRRSSPKRASPPRRVSPARELKKLLSPVKSENQRAAETVIVADLPDDISEQALLDELTVYGDVTDLEFLRNESDEVLNSARVRFASGDSVDRILATDFGATPILRGASVYKARKGLPTARELDKELEGAPTLPYTAPKKTSTRRRRGGRGRGGKTAK